MFELKPLPLLVLLIGLALFSLTSYGAGLLSQFRDWIYLAGSLSAVWFLVSRN